MLLLSFLYLFKVLLNAHHLAFDMFFSHIHEAYLYKGQHLTTDTERENGKKLLSNRETQIVIYILIAKYSRITVNTLSNSRASPQSSAV